MKRNEPKAADRFKTSVQIFKSLLPKKDTYAVIDAGYEYIYGNKVTVAHNEEVAMIDYYDGERGAFVKYKRSGFMSATVSEYGKGDVLHSFSLDDQGDLFDEWLFRKLRELGFKKDVERYEQMRLF